MLTERLKEAHRRFHDAMAAVRDELPQDTCSRLGQISFPSGNENVSVEEQAAKLELSMDSLMVAMRVTEGIKRNHVKNIVKSWFRSSYYFLRLSLEIAEVASSVCWLCISFTCLSRFPY